MEVLPSFGSFALPATVLLLLTLAGGFWRPSGHRVQRVAFLAPFTAVTVALPQAHAHQGPQEQHRGGQGERSEGGQYFHGGWTDGQQARQVGKERRTPNIGQMRLAINVCLHKSRIET